MTTTMLPDFAKLPENKQLNNMLDIHMTALLLHNTPNIAGWDPHRLKMMKTIDSIHRYHFLSQDS
jgi:hypothetical protein